MPQNVPIRITAVSGSTLTLSDNGNSYVDPGDTVTWSVQPGVDVILTSISVDPGSTDLFSHDPAKVGSSNQLRGTISANVQMGAIENYTIHWNSSKDANQELKYIYDKK